uniref:Uncharacterized protein n=1 Tax=Megaselia scalaris TaxID=36166 RepID=T1GUA5_MEGSC
MKKNATAKELEKILESKYQKISKELDKAAKNKKKKSKKKRKSSSDESSSNTPSPEPKRKYKTHSSRSSQTSRSKSPAKKRFSRSVSPNRKFSYHRRSRSLSRTPVDKNLDRKRSRSRSFHRKSSRSPHQLRHKNNPFKSEPRNFSRSPRKDNPFQKNHSHFGRKSISPRRRSPNSYQNTRIQSNRSNSRSKNWGNPFSSSKHSEEEKQRRLKEMTQNAAWRDEDRTRHVQKYREDYRREEDDHRKREFDNDFVNKQVHKAYDSQNSVESRLKSHKNNIQRSAHSMNSNFARK